MKNMTYATLWLYTLTINTVVRAFKLLNLDPNTCYSFRVSLKADIIGITQTSIFHKNVYLETNIPKLEQ